MDACQPVTVTYDDIRAVTEFNLDAGTVRVTAASYAVGNAGTPNAYQHGNRYPIRAAIVLHAHGHAVGQPRDSH